MMETFNGALLLRERVFEQLRGSPQVVRRGMMIVLLVGIIVGAVDGIHILVAALNINQTIEQQRGVLESFLDDFEQQIEQEAVDEDTTQQQQQSLLVSRQIVTIGRQNLDPYIAMVRDLSTLPGFLPRPVGALAYALGALVSTPLAYLAALLTAVVFTHIAAGWFGGQGNIQQMIGVGALSVAPHLLDALANAFGFIESLSGLIGAIAWVWGLFIFILATSVVHRIDTGRAALAVFLFPLIGFFLAILGFCALFLFSIASLATLAG
ncbi:MAG: YIP1 family protein [Chloroflexaceae bacterium]|nr:YIP1 family protein [Chloroflexaceae bacterium]